MDLKDKVALVTGGASGFGEMVISSSWTRGRTIEKLDE